MKLLKLSLLSALLLTISYSGFAQSSEEHVNHFSMGISAGVLQDQWHLNPADSIGGIKESSSGRLGYSGSVSGAYTMCKHWKLKVSPGIQSRKFDERLDGLHFAIDFDGTGFKDSHIIYHIKATTLTVPVTVEYVFGTKKILPFISVGVAAEVVLKLNSDGTIYYSNGSTDLSVAGMGLRKTNIAALAAAGIYYQATDKVSLSISPVFSYSLLEDGQNRHQYSFGATAGVFCNFGK